MSCDSAPAKDGRSTKPIAFFPVLTNLMGRLREGHLINIRVKMEYIFSTHGVQKMVFASAN
jgi:hypothetical protein